ncbi:MAG: PAC2 family protein, partial [Candidatus Bathyarchaeota archaeon]|nr:PAC2 family protein [Candidatus Bathyarchaeota archaeon]
MFKEKDNLEIKPKFLPPLTSPIAIVGSPGLRSVGKLALTKLVKKLKAKLFLQIYSKSFPLFYETKPSYAPIPGFLGDVGIKFKDSKLILPKINFYFTDKPETILVSGYHANFQGQYEAAWKVVDLLEKFNVKKMIVLAGYGMDGPDVCCAATKKDLLDEAKKNFGLDIGYEGPFMGFSG